MPRFVLVLILVLSGVLSASAEEDTGWRPMWLAISPGFSQVAIVAEKPSRAARKAGVTQSRLREAVELRLRRNGVRIADEEGFWTPRLSVKVGVSAIEGVDSPFDLHVYTVRVVLWTVVGVKLPPPVGDRWVRTDVWRNGVTGWTADSARLADLVDQEVVGFTDALSLDFLRAETEYSTELQRWAATIE